MGTKKRLIFTLHFEDGYFVLSRNFRTQRVGDLAWLEKNYGFQKVSAFVDELIILNVSSQPRQHQSRFLDSVEEISRGCFAPVSVGGGIRGVEDAREAFAAGADKIVVNELLHFDTEAVEELGNLFGAQSLIASVDVSRSDSEYRVMRQRARIEGSFDPIIRLAEGGLFGEIYLNSVDKDGTGTGLDLQLPSYVVKICGTRPSLVLAGGAGKPEHLLEGLRLGFVNGVATANLLNFVGGGLRNTRALLLGSGIDLASWPVDESKMSTSPNS